MSSKPTYMIKVFKELMSSKPTYMIKVLKELMSSKATYMIKFFKELMSSKPTYSRTSLARTSLSRTYPYVEVFSRSRSHCSLFQYNSTSIRRIYISKFIHTSNEFQSPITIVRTYSHIFTPKLICKRRCLRSIRFSHLSTCQLW